MDVCLPQSGLRFLARQPQPASSRAAQLVMCCKVNRRLSVPRTFLITVDLLAALLSFCETLRVLSRDSSQRSLPSAAGGFYLARPQPRRSRQAIRCRRASMGLFGRRSSGSGTPRGGGDNVQDTVEALQMKINRTDPGPMQKSSQ